MKKVLFATTALIATASVAAADVRISGYGRFGIAYDKAAKTAAPVAPATTARFSSTSLTSRLRLQFDMSAETDSGVTLGARFRAQAESRGNRPGTAVFNGARFFATYEGFSVGVGNIIGAFENMPGLYLETRTAGLGIDGAGFTSIVSNSNGTAFTWDAYSSGGAGVNGVELIYSNAGFVGHVSYSENNKTSAAAARVSRTAVMLSYNFGDWTVAAAHSKVSNPAVGQGDKLTGAAISGSFGQFGVRLAYADNDGAKKVGLYGNMDIGAASNLLIFVTNESDYTGAAAVGQMADADTHGTNYGIHYSYDLGGGASFEAGAVRHTTPGAGGAKGPSNTRAQAGVYFSF